MLNERIAYKKPLTHSYSMNESQKKKNATANIIVNMAIG